MPKKKQLAYSRRTHDKRIYGTHVFNPHFLDIIATRCVADINEARRRVLITSSGKYQYEPSEEYKKTYKKYCSSKSITNGDRSKTKSQSNDRSNPRS